MSHGHVHDGSEGHDHSHGGGHVRVGGMTTARPADADAVAAANAVRAEVEAKAGGAFSKYAPTEVATQVVAGVNYFIKVDVGSKFVFIRVYRDLQSHYSLHSIQDNKTAADHLNYW